MGCVYAAKLTDTMEKQQIEHSPWYHITPFRVILHSGWIMAFQRTECSLGPAVKSDKMNLKSIRCTSVTRKVVIDHIMNPKLGVYPTFTCDQLWWKQHRIKLNHSVSQVNVWTVSESHLQVLPRKSVLVSFLRIQSRPSQLPDKVIKTREEECFIMNLSLRQ